MKMRLLACQIASISCALLAISPALAADPDPAVQAATNAKAIAEAERDEAKARLETAKAEAELATVEAAQAAKNAEALATAEKAGFDKDKAAADARAAAIAADQAATKAKFGSVSANGVTPGTVEAGSGAGTSEATILAARALNDLAGQVAAKVENDVVVIPGNTRPQFGNLQLYQFRKELTLKLFQQANKASVDADTAFANLKVPQPALARGGASESIGTVITGAGAVLDAASKIASFFQTSYKFENVTVAGLTDTVFAAAVAGQIKEHNVYLPDRMTNSAGATAIFDELSSAVNKRLTSGSNQAVGEAALIQLAAILKAAKADADKAAVQNVIDMYTRSVADEKAASKIFDDFYTALAANDSGKSMIGRIIEEKNLSDLLGDCTGLPVLYVNVSMQGGTSYTRKSLWNFLGAQPFFVSGGLVANWVMVDRTGKVINSGVVSKYSGYKSVGSLER